MFVAGSNNYGLDDSSSDLDTKAIVLPHFIDIVRSKQWVTDTIINADDSHTEVKDIRNMFDCYKKQNVNFLETLFTKYYYLNPDYTGEWLGAIVKNREKIAHYDECRAIKAMYGNMLTKYKNMYKSMPHSAAEIEQYGYALKDYHHLMRLAQFIRRYISGEKYESILIAEETLNTTKKLVDDTLVEWEQTKKVDKEAEEILHRVEFDFIKQSLLHDLETENG